MAVKFDDHAVDVNFTNDAICIVLADGREISAPLEWFPKLRDASHIYLSELNFRINASTQPATFKRSSIRKPRCSDGYTCDFLQSERPNFTDCVAPKTENSIPIGISRDNWRFIGNGVGVHWPDIDEDIAVSTLMQGHD